MSYDRQQFLDTVKAKAQTRQRGVESAYRVVQAAGQVMAHLTQSDDWNRFLGYLQGQVNRTREAKEAAQRKLADPAIWDAKDLTKLKSDILIADGMIAAYELAMKLPAALIEGGAEATEFLNKLERKDEAETPGQVQP